MVNGVEFTETRSVVSETLEAIGRSTPQEDSATEETPRVHNQGDD